MNAEPNTRKTNILIAGASGFIGSRLVRRLSSDGDYHVKCITRIAGRLQGEFPSSVQIIRADASNLKDLIEALQGVDVAFYLIHSMDGSPKEWKKFEERDRRIARNFAIASSRCNVKRIIYLGGLTNEKDVAKLSAHMRSREEVGEILKESTARVTIFRAAVILGYEGGSSQMLSYLVERLPVMVCPKWVLTKSQPIAVDDVVEYLARSIKVTETEGGTFDIGGREVMSYVDMMKGYAGVIGKSVRIVVIPFLTPRLSSYWVDLVTPVNASLARPLIDSLKYEAVVEDHSIENLIPIKLTSFKDAVQQSKHEEQLAQSNRTGTHRSFSLNIYALWFSLIAVGVLNATSLLLSQIAFLGLGYVLSVLLYLGMILSAFFLPKGARLGSLVAGLTFWIAMGIVAVDLIGPDTTLRIALLPAMIGIISGIGIISSHLEFHRPASPIESRMT